MSEGSATVRAMTLADVPAAAALAARAFGWDLEARERELPGVKRSWSERVELPLRTDPAGAFVAEVDGTVVGVAEAIVRDDLWVLSLLTVDPDRQSGGAGRRVLAAALAYAGPDARAEGEDLPGLIVASSDSRALRMYGRSGFELMPTFLGEGELDGSRLPALSSEIRDLTADEVDEFAELTRAVRGAPWTGELKWVIEQEGGSVQALADRGIVVVDGGGARIWSLVAADDESARQLLIAGLRRCVDRAGAGEHPKIEVRWLTARQQWAISLLLEIGVPISPYGALCVRGRPGRLSPLIPSGPFA